MKKQENTKFGKDGQYNENDEEEVLHSSDMSDGEYDDQVNDLANPSQYNGEFGDSLSISQRGGDRSRTKRRSKNDNSGRDYKCGCNKRYLSYPALYTHIKQKHNGRTPPGTIIRDILTGRGRGRPKKIQGDDKNFKEAPEYWIDIDNYADGHEIDIFNPSNFSAIEVTKTELKQVTDKIEEELEILKEEIEVSNQQTNTSEWFYDVSHLQYSLQKMKEIMIQQPELFIPLDKPLELDTIEKQKMIVDAQEYIESLYPIVQELAPLVVDQFQNQWFNKLSHDNLETSKFNKATMFIINMNEEQKKQLKIDEIFALYLIDISQNLSLKFYKLTACFIQLFRNCINLYGHQILSGITPIEEKNYEYKNNKLDINFENHLELLQKMEEQQKQYITQKAYKSQNNEKEQKNRDDGITIEREEEEQMKNLQILKNNIDIVPHMANIFIQKYLPEKCNVFSEKHAIVLMQHLIKWMGNRRFLNIQITLNQDFTKTIIKK